MSTDSPPNTSSWKGRLQAVSASFSNRQEQALALFKKMSDHLMALLRLFAIISLCLMVGLIVKEIIQSSNLVMVKSFTLPKTMQEINPDGGRVIANQLSEAMQRAEGTLYCNISGAENCESSEVKQRVTGNTDNFLLGSNIKLPETGISIGDVVEFISKIFGRRNIVGSVYQDNGNLYLQVELDGVVFTYKRPLNTCIPDAIIPSTDSGTPPACTYEEDKLKELRTKQFNADLIKDMLEKSSIDLLSVASAEHNLFYFCSGQTKYDGHKNEASVKEWFQYCADLQSANLKSEEFGVLMRTLETKNRDAQTALQAESDIVAGVRKITYNNALAKTKVFCPGYDKFKGCESKSIADVAATEKQKIVFNAPEPSLLLPTPPAPIVAPAIAPALPPHGTQAGTIPNDTAVPPKPASEPVGGGMKSANANLASLQSIWSQCVGIPTSVAILASNQAENDGKQAFNNGLYQQASDAYGRALSHNCRNIFAWANIGLLFMRQNDIESATFALQRSIEVNPGVDWIQNSLCIAEAYAEPLDTMTAVLSKTPSACGAARTLNPANTVILDKQFYLAVAERFFDAKRYKQAAAAYQTALSIDRKLDCNTSKAIIRLREMEAKYKVAGAEKAACEIKLSAIPLSDNRQSSCQAELDAFICPTAN
jgi:hypothetical protein